MDTTTHSEKMKASDYFRLAKAHLRESKQKEALVLLQSAVLHYPDEPTLMSYYGRLLAIVERKYRIGIETCQTAIAKLQIRGNQEEKTVYSVFYYNLGLAYLAAGKRKESIDAFYKGLSYDPGNYDIMKDLKSLGVRRKKPPIPFLDRSNPLNKYIGIFLHNRKNRCARVAAKR